MSGDRAGQPDGGRGGRPERRDRPDRGGDAHPGQGHLTPQNLEAEEAILGAMISSQRAIEIADDVGLRASDFYRPSHRIIFTAIKELAARDAVDELTVVNELRRTQRINEAGGQVAVVSLVERVPSVANARAYAEEVIAQATLRGLVETGHEIARLGYEHPEDPPTLVDQAGVLVSDLAQQRENADFVDQADLLAPIYDELSERAEAGGKARGVPTGFLEFDKMTGGLQNGALVVVAARPAMGKTSWVLNVAEHIALKEKRPVALFSLEMAANDLVTRLLCSVARVDQGRIRNEVPHEADWPHLVEAISKLNAARGLMHIDQSSSLTPMELRSKVRRLNAKLKSEGGLSCIIIDYLQLMEAGVRTDSRQVEVSYISRKLKSLALELNIPVIALSQLSRKSEERTEKRPLLSDLRESGAIEQDADLVMFLHRPEVYDRDDPTVAGKAELIIAKHRNGRTGATWLGFLGKYTKFVNLELHREPPPAIGGPQPAAVGVPQHAPAAAPANGGGESIGFDSIPFGDGGYDGDPVV